MAWLAAALPAAASAAAPAAAGAAGAASAGAGAVGAAAPAVAGGSGIAGSIINGVGSLMKMQSDYGDKVQADMDNTAAMGMSTPAPAAQPGWFDRLKTGYNGGVGDFMGNAQNFNVPETLGYIAKRKEKGRGQPALDYYQEIYNKFR
jgi:hypothetical protein